MGVTFNIETFKSRSFVKSHNQKGIIMGAEKIKYEIGKCSVPMWSGLGTPSGSCCDPAFGKQTEEYTNPDRWHKHNIKHKVTAMGLACPGHGGPKCPGIEIETDVWSGCNGKHGDCPTCGQ